MKYINIILTGVFDLTHIFSATFDSCQIDIILTAVSLTFVSLVEHKMRRGRLSAAEHGAERGQCTREEPSAGGLLLCERFLGWAHLLAGADTRPALAAFGGVRSVETN